MTAQGAPNAPLPGERCTPARPPVAILGVPIDDVSTGEAIELITRMMLSGRPHYFATANVDFLVQAQHDPELHRILLDADLVVCDGSPVLWASRLLGHKLPERVAGSDLVPLLLRVAAERGLRVYLLGATGESMADAIARLRREYPGLVVAGHYSPPFAPLLDMDHAAITGRIRDARPDLLLVAFGCPKQEKWIAMHSRTLGVPVSAGIGASIDFLSGHVRRAPLWMQRIGLEWAFRLLQEPRRLAARYARDFRVFGWRLLAQYRLLGRHASGLEKRPATGAIADGRDRVLDLAAIEAIDSTGLGFLLGLRRDIRAGNGELVLLAPSAAVVRALRLMQLDDVFPVAPDLASARRLIDERRRQRAESVSENAALDGVIAWHGELTAENVHSVWLATQPHAEQRAKAGGALTIDLSDLRFVDSAGLLLMKRAQQSGTPLAFRQPSPAVRRIARLAGVERSLFDADDGRRV